jgi:uncharacterized protein YejL (UPF0352 family)
MSLHQAKPEHEVLYQEIVALIDKHAGKLSAMEMLAVASNMLGKLIAMQDQRVITPAMAMEIVAHNIEHGNKEVLDQLGHSRGQA